MKRFFTRMLASAVVAAVAVSSIAAQTVDPFGKYDPPITLTTVVRASSSQNIDPTVWEVNNWTKYLKEQGIILKVLWSVDAGQYEQKLNLAIASGEIPDIIPMVYANQAQQLMKSNMLLDMKPALDKYLSPSAKAHLTSDGGASMNPLINKAGKQFLLPNGPKEVSLDTQNLWIRKDWLKKLGLKEPKTWQEFLNVCDAFVNKDPDGDGVKNTVALGIHAKSIINDWGSLDGYFNMFHASPNIWWDNTLFFEKDASGKVVWSGAKPEMLKALETLQTFYKKGYINKDFPTNNNIQDDVIAGKVGMIFATNWFPEWPLTDAKKKNPASDWEVIMAPTFDGKGPALIGHTPGNAFSAVSAKCKYPDAVAKLYNYLDRFKTNGTAEQADLYLNKTTGREEASPQRVPVNMQDPTEQTAQYQLIRKAITSKDPSVLKTAEQKQKYDNYMAYQADPTKIEVWRDYHTYSGEVGTAGHYFFEEIKASDIKMNLYTVLPTELMASKASVYDQMAQKTITEIILGKPVSNWTKMVADWNKIAGNAILKEVEASLN